MGKNKKILCVPVLAFGIMLVLCACAFAASNEAVPVKQYQQGKPLSVDKLIGKLTIYLSLTDEQARQIKPVIEDDASQRSEIIKNSKGDQAALKTAFDGLKLRTNKKLSQYLTEEQMKKLEEMQKAQPDQTGSKKGGRGGKGGMGGGKPFGHGMF